MNDAAGQVMRLPVATAAAAVVNNRAIDVNSEARRLSLSVATATGSLHGMAPRVQYDIRSTKDRIVIGHPLASLWRLTTASVERLLLAPYYILPHTEHTQRS